MQISVSDAKGQLTDPVRRAEAGEEIVLTRHGHPAARLVPIKRTVTSAHRRKMLEEVRRQASTKVQPGPDAARNQDWLYDDEGLPG